MNKIFRVIWSKASGCYVVVSEKVSAHCGGSVLGKGLLIAMLALCLLNTSAYADFTVDGAPVVGATYTNSTTVGRVVVASPSTSIVNSGTIHSGIYASAGNSIDLIQNDVGGLIASGDTAIDYTDNFTGTLSNAGTILADSSENVIGVSIGGDLSGTIDNSGFINATATNCCSAYASGIYIGGDVTSSGEITNSGTIAASTPEHTASCVAIANGIIVNGDMAGSIVNTNTGTIEATIVQDECSATAAGVNVVGSLTGSIENHGNITVNPLNSSSDATGYGIYVGRVTLDGSIENSGTISVDVEASSDAEAYGIYVASGMSADGSITNTGIIDVDANGSCCSSPYGIYVGGVFSGTIENSGTIQAIGSEGIGVDIASNYGTLVNSGTIYGESVGVYIDDDLGGTITNQYGGIISAEDSAIDISSDFSGTLTNAGTIKASDDSATGINISGELSGDINNSNTIIASFSSAGGISAYGIYVGSGIASTGSITNSGTIDTEAIATTSHGATAHGIYVSGDVAGCILNTNTGTINATAESGSSDVSPLGIYVDGSLTGTGSITNDGTINVSGDAGHCFHDAAGIYVSSNVEAGASISNTGSITLDLVGRSDGCDSATGIYVGGDMQGSLTNSGSITMTSHVESAESSDFTGIYVDTLSGTLTNTSSGTITVSQTVTSASNADYGVYVSTLTGTLNNQGAITVTGTGEGSEYNEYAAGVYIETLDSAGAFTNSGTIEGIAVSHATASGVEVYTLDGTLTNSGTISARGDDVADAWSVYASSGTGTINNQAGGLLSGILEVKGGVNVNNSGTIAIPALSEGGYIGGNYTQTATGTFRTAVASETSYGQLTVKGTATLPSNAKIDVDVIGSPSLTKGAELPDIISAGTLVSDGTFVVTDNSTIFDFTAQKDGKTVDLIVDGGMAILDATVIAGNQPGTGSARTLDTIKDDPTLGSSDAWAPVMTALGQCTTEDEVSDAVSQTLPLLTASADAAIENTLHGVNRIVLARQEAARGLSSGDDFFVDKNIWIKPFGSWADQDDRKGVSGFDADVYGLIGGADAEINSSNRLGVAFAYANSDVDSNSSVAPNSADIDSYQFILYGSHAFDERTEANFQADLGFHNTDGRREIIFMSQVAKSDYDSWSGHIGADIGRTYPLGEKTEVLPSIGFDYAGIHSDSYTEKGAGALNLKVNSNNTEEFILSVDAKVSHSVTDRTKLEANLGGGYDLINDNSSITSAFAGSPSSTFATEGIDPSLWIGRAGLGIVSQTSDAIELSARYDVEAREDFDNQTVSIKLNWNF